MIAGVLLILVGLGIGGYGYYIWDSLLCISFLGVTECAVPSSGLTDWLMPLFGAELMEDWFGEEAVWLVTGGTVKTVSMVMMVVGGILAFFGAGRLWYKIT